MWCEYCGDEPTHAGNCPVGGNPASFVPHPSLGEPPLATPPLCECDAAAEFNRRGREIQALRRVLRFYADPKTYAGMVCESPGPLYTDIETGRGYGDRARTVLFETLNEEVDEDSGRPVSDYIECHACSVAGGADLPVKHLPPACPD